MNLGHILDNTIALPFPGWGAKRARARLAREASRQRHEILLSTYDAAINEVASNARDGDAVIVMGARDPGLPGLARAVLGRLGQ